MKTKIYVEVKAINLKDRQVLKFTLITFFLIVFFFFLKTLSLFSKVQCAAGMMLCNNKSKSNAKRPLWPVCVVGEINVICTHLHTDTFQAFSSTCLLFYYRYTRDAQIMVEINGVSQKALFSFEAFRLVDNEYETVSTFYLLCATRLCEVSKRRSLLSVSSLHRL